MSVRSALSVPSIPRRVSATALLAGLAVLATVQPVGAWQIADRTADPRPRIAPDAEPASPPIDSIDEALAAGGASPDERRRRTVLRQGIDVSHWQGYVRWKVVRRTVVDFAIAKATEGIWMVDPWYERNRNRAMKAGIHFTAYHFANPGRGRYDAKREADWFLDHADLRGANLIPALDLERSGGLGPRKLTRWTMQWLRRVKQRLGVKPMVYTSPGFWTGHLGNTTRIARAGYEVLWIGHWETHRPSVPARRWAGEGWTIWQWTETGRVPGVRGWVDRNIYSGPKLRWMTIREVRRASRR
jgi:lysozyme